MVGKYLAPSARDDTHSEESKSSAGPPRQKTLCGQLAPALDRLGRLLVDIAPQFAAVASPEQCAHGPDGGLEIPRTHANVMPGPAEIGLLGRSTERAGRVGEVHVHEIIFSRVGGRARTAPRSQPREAEQRSCETQTENERREEAEKGSGEKKS